MESHPPFSFELEPSWQDVLQEEFKKPYLTELAGFLNVERNSLKSVFPAKESVFQAFFKTPFQRVKVVILGQDPYHGPGQAHGLSFSVPRGIKLPPSLKNIFKELKSDLGIDLPPHGCLDSWAEQGVFLLNAILTVRQSAPLSHQKRGWEYFTDAVVGHLMKRKEPLVFLLWGKYAQDKYLLGAQGNRGFPHLVLTAPHPSPFSAYQGFLGCRHFSQANAFLSRHGIKPIDWSLQ